MLLTSTPVDQRAGAMFAWNTPVVLLMAIAVFRSGRIAAAIALLAMAIQLVIAVLSRYLAIGGDLLGTIVVNGPIVIVLLALSIWSNRRSSDGTIADVLTEQTGG
jgi:hypothetical protein